MLPLSPRYEPNAIMTPHATLIEKNSCPMASRRTCMNLPKVKLDISGITYANKPSIPVVVFPKLSVWLNVRV